VTTLSDPTLGLLIQAGAELYTRSELDTMLMRAHLRQFALPGADANKQELLRRHLLGAQAAASRGNAATHRALLDFVLLVFRNADPNIPAEKRGSLDRLYEGLLADGYRVALSSTGTIELFPTDPSTVPLAGEITALEAELSARGYNTVLNHYQQAVNALVNHMYESANGALRTTLEDLVTRLAEERGYQRLSLAGQGWRAIKYLVEGGHLPERDGGQFLQGLWQMTHTNGPHPGQSVPTRPACGCRSLQLLPDSCSGTSQVPVKRRAQSERQAAQPAMPPCPAVGAKRLIWWRNQAWEGASNLATTRPAGKTRKAQ
jgi:hypothetical protein